MTEEYREQLNKSAKIAKKELVRIYCLRSGLLNDESIKILDACLAVLKHVENHTQEPKKSKINLNIY